ncbi:MAG: hypothetical protein WAM14_08580, partial [Candidatus Nitrosopolaris sp.]
KQMKRGYSKLLYSQRNKDETIGSASHFDNRFNVSHFWRTISARHFNPIIVRFKQSTHLILTLWNEQ